MSDRQQLPGIHVGQTWTWEPLSPDAREVLTVTQVWWDGEECRIEAISATGVHGWWDAEDFIKGCVYGEAPDLANAVEEAEDFRAEIAKEAFTAPDADWGTILDSLRARIADLPDEGAPSETPVTLPGENGNSEGWLNR